MNDRKTYIEIQLIDPVGIIKYETDKKITFIKPLRNQGYMQETFDICEITSLTSSGLALEAFRQARSRAVPKAPEAEPILSSGWIPVNHHQDFSAEEIADASPAIDSQRVESALRDGRILSVQRNRLLP